MSEWRLREKPLPEHLRTQVENWIYRKGYSNPGNHYVGYLHWNEEVGEIIEYVFAYKKRKKGILINEVMRKAPDKGILFKDMYLTAMSGYSVVYSRADARSRRNYYGYSPFSENDFGVWDFTFQDIGVCISYLNLDDLFKNEKYKYCGYTVRQGNIMKYLEFYNQYPETEYFGKLGIKITTTLVKKAKSDKQFCRFLMDNKENCQICGPTQIIYAYNHKMSFKEAAEHLGERREQGRYMQGIRLKGTKINKVKLYEYLVENNVKPLRYADYLEACKTIGLDMTDTKNAFPRDFDRMHDLRINQRTSLIAQKDLEKKAKLFDNFVSKANRLKEFEIKGDDFSVIIPSVPQDLVNEGKRLHHCVGAMGYDAKFARGESFIAFVRVTGAENVPFVTVEYNLKQLKVWQQYGDSDSRPSDEVIEFINKWQQGVTKVLLERKINERNNQRTLGVERNNMRQAMQI